MATRLAMFYHAISCTRATVTIAVCKVGFVACCNSFVFYDIVTHDFVPNVSKINTFLVIRETLHVSGPNAKI